MLRSRFLLICCGIALLIVLILLGRGDAAPTGAGGAAPARSPESPLGETVARSDDGAFSMRLLSPRSPYLFGRQRIEVAADLPSGDRVKTVDFFVDGRLRRTSTRAPFALEIDFGEEIEPHTIVILGATFEGRTARLSAVSRSANLQSRVEVSLVTIPVVVRDRQGRFIENLTVSDFTLLEDEAPQTIVHFDRDPTPVSLILALDASDSMKGTLWSAQKAANDFIESLPSFYKISVIGFSDSVTLARDFTFDRRGLAFAVNNLKTAGGTALYDTLRASTSHLRERRDRRVAVLFTDGGESIYGEDPAGIKRLEESLRLAREAGVTFYTIAFGPGAAVSLLKRIAEETGGEFKDSRDPGALRAIYARIGDDLNHQYTLSYYPIRLASEGGWRTITVRVSRPEATVRARAGYLAAR